MFNKIVKFIVIVCIIATGVGIFFYFSFSPTPNFIRNNKVDGVEMKVKVSNDDRIPIIRTFKEEDYLKLDEDEISKVKDKISGKVEGDIPSIHLKDDNKLYFKFIKDGKVVEPDNSRIKIYASASDYRDDIKLREISGNLIFDKSGVYFYYSKRYGTQFEKYFIEYLRVEVYYSINGEDYVSTFGVFQDNADDGTDYFDNEELDKPILPEE